MPGVSLKCVLSRKETSNAHLNRDEEFLKTLRSRIYNNSYKSEILLKNDRYLIGCTKYSGYPVKIFESNRYWVCLEGMIYDEDNIDGKIFELLNNIFMHKLISETDKEIISNQLLKTDGEFIIYAMNKRDGSFVIINDILGRLPLYYYHKRESELIVSRELPFLASLTGDDPHEDNRFDRIGMAQYLLIGFPLGNRTLLADVSRLKPASLLRVTSNSEVNVDYIHCLNFDIIKNENRSVESNARELVSLFNKACKNRASHKGENIIFLSGGFDSRCVLACFHKNSISGLAFTILDPKWTPVVGRTSEAEVAEQLSKSVNFDWENYDFIEPNPENLSRLLDIKSGFPYLANRYLLPSLDNLKDRHNSGSNIIFTGHGGEIIRPSPYRNRIKNLEHLINLITRGNGSFAIQEVAALLRIEEIEIIDDVKKVLNAYPEKNMNKKYLHLLYFESSPWVFFESEDIFRHYFWTTSPYYSIPFYNYAINCPEMDKSGHILYKHFLGILSHSILAIRTSNWGCSVLSNKYKVLQIILSIMWKHRYFSKFILNFLQATWKYPVLNKLIIKKDNRRRNDDLRIVKCIREQISLCDDISKYLSENTIKKILDDYDSLSDVGIHNLFDITLLIERLSCNKSTIRKYFEY